MIDAERIGRAIRTLRIKAGYTQKELAEKLFISDVAVSKWERGKSVPDTATLMKLSALLDMDVDGLLDGTATHTGDRWIGILLLEEQRLRADTLLWDKPLIDYQLSYFLLAGIRELLIACNEEDQDYIRRRFRCGETLGMQLRFALPDELTATAALEGAGVGELMFISEPVFLYGVDLTRFFQRAMMHNSPVVNLASVVGQGGAPLKEGFSLYTYQTLPIYFLQGRFLADCGNNFLKDVAKIAEEKKSLHSEPMDKGFLFSTLQDEQDAETVSVLIRNIQKLGNYLIYCPPEIAWRRGIINEEKIKSEATQVFPEYREYLSGLR